MTQDDIICTACMRWHPPPRCDHDASLPCAYCLKPRGYRFNLKDGSVGGRANQCWRCWFAAQPAGSVT